MTHALQVLHTLQWHHPWWRALAQLAQAPSQDYHFYTHTLLGGVDGGVTSPNGSPVRWQENTELLSVCGLTGTPQCVSLLGLGGKECSFGVHGAYVDGVGLPALPQAEAELFVWCVQRPCLAGQAKKNRCCTNHPDLPTCKAKANEGQFETEEPRLPPRVIRFSGSPIIRCSQTALSSKQA